MSKIYNCVVCEQPIPTGYRGRPRKVCGEGCYNVRRNIRGKNRSSIAKAERHLLLAVQHLVPWPDLQVEVLSLFSDVRNTPDEVTEANLGQRAESENQNPEAKAIN